MLLEMQDSECTSSYSYVSPSRLCRMRPSHMPSFALNHCGGLGKCLYLHAQISHQLQLSSNKTKRNVCRRKYMLGNIK